MESWKNETGHNWVVWQHNDIRETWNFSQAHRHCPCTIEYICGIFFLKILRGVWGERGHCDHGKKLNYGKMKVTAFLFPVTLNKKKRLGGTYFEIDFFSQSFFCVNCIKNSDNFLFVPPRDPPSPLKLCVTHLNCDYTHIITTIISNPSLVYCCHLF